jgi:hypothetical protein
VKKYYIVVLRTNFAMEANIILEGYQNLLKENIIKILELILDGDSSAYYALVTHLD